MKQPLKIIKASAGSGKTFTLTREYIKFLIPADDRPFDRNAFRHILAVTFTNKATEEMKSRIVRELDLIAHEEGYRFPADQIATPLMRERAEEALTAILHDYSSFSVSTIDKFFQVVMRAFAREINQYASYKVELDTGAVLAQAVDNMMDSLDPEQNAPLLKWLTDYSMEKIQEGKTWDITRELKENAKLFMKEGFKQSRRSLPDDCWSKDAISSFKATLDEIISKGESPEATAEDVNTAILLKDNLHMLGIFSDLYKSLNEYLKEHNLVLLSETTDVLSRIIDGSDTPFIYEKVGTRYDHYMLDEFQDTSRMQWDNFKPLLKDSVDRGEGSLIVGDIKQSIYRWRDSDLNLLGSEVQKSFRNDQFSTETKQQNWRSYGNIVKFNNGFYSQLGVLLRANGVDAAETISGYYKDVEQDAAHKEYGGLGHVRVEFLERPAEKGTKWTDVALEKIEPLMAELTAKYRPCDIAFLVRKNAEGAQVAQRLLSLGYDVITEDSLKLSSSELVRKVVSLLRFLVNPEDPTNKMMLKMFFGKEDLALADTSASDSLYEICDSLLRNYVGEIPAGEHPFVFAFLDEVIAYTDKFGSNPGGFLQWWDDTGSGHYISAPKSDRSVTVMTVHKAKGLSFPAVVLPMFNETLQTVAAQAPYIWCKPRVEPFSSIRLVPLKATKSAMEKTIFAEDYHNESLLQSLDAINTAYVAMTRAVSDMIIYAPVPKFTKTGKLSKSGMSVSDMLYMYLKSASDSPGAPFVREVGEMCSSEERRHEDPSAGVVATFSSHPYSGRLRLSLKGGEFFEKQAEGIRYHDLLSAIDTAEDVHRAVEDAVVDGIVKKADAEQVEAKVSALIESVAPRHWFDGTYRSLREMSIIDSDGASYRPDRVLVEKDKPLGQGKAIVIDYKFGKKENKYAQQIKRYMNLLSEMGYSDVKGTIWYCNEEVQDIH